MRNMSRCWMYPELKTMAWGGVATGSMNTQDAATAKGRMISVVDIPMSMATVAKIATRRAVLSVLLEISVRKITMMPINRRVGQPSVSAWI